MMILGSRVEVGVAASRRSIGDAARHSQAAHEPRNAAELNGQHVKLVRFEPAGTLKTGDAAPGEMTVAAPKWLGD